MTEGESPLPEWQRAHGDPVVDAAIRCEPSDFLVDEELGFAPAGNGEHDLLRVEKTDTNTTWVAERLAAHARVRPVDVGYSGLKDRRAVTTQWYSVRRPSADGTDWSVFSADGVRLLEVHRHTRKLRRGSHAANRFRIALRGRGFDACTIELAARVESIAASGVPNYFGPQRFGRGGGNIALAKRCFDGERMRRNRRSLAISAARSLIFNEILDRRAGDGSWDRLLAGDLANLDGTNSVFAVDAVTAELEERCVELDIHPTGTLWGRDAPLSDASAADLESDVAARFTELADGLVRQGIRAASRPLRMRVDDVKFDVADDVIRLGFRLRGGAYATSVLREIAKIDDA